MGTMTVERVGIYTTEDLERERERDPRLRWELLRGELVVTPAPRYPHQHAVGRLFALVLAALEEGQDVVVAPFDVFLSTEDVLQPDLLLARREDIAVDGLHRAPLLAVEVLSPSTRRHDLITKFEVLGRAGCDHYWIVDPDSGSVRMWRLIEGRYELQVKAEADDEVHVTEPVELTFRVRDLLPPSTDG